MKNLLILLIFLLTAVTGAAQQQNLPFPIPAPRDSIPSHAALAPYKIDRFALRLSMSPFASPAVWVQEGYYKLPPRYWNPIWGGAPGLGQIYNGEKKKGYFMMGLFAPCFVGNIVLVIKAARPDGRWTDSEKVLFAESIVGYAGIWAWSCFDAPLSARRINRVNGYSDPPAKQNPGLALGLSYWPGTGQFYNGQNWKGAWFWSLTAASFGLAATGKKPQSYIGIGLFGINLVWAMADAYISAKRINRENGYSGLQNPGAGLVFVPDPRNPRRLQPGVGLRAGF